MADLEAVLADVSYLMAMEKSKSTPAARASKKIILPDPRYKLFGDLSMHSWYKIPIDQSPRTQTKWVPEGGSRDDNIQYRNDFRW